MSCHNHTWSTDMAADAPPPLEAMADQLQALRSLPVSELITEARPLEPAAILDPCSDSCRTPALRRGFLDGCGQRVSVSMRNVYVVHFLQDPINGFPLRPGQRRRAPPKASESAARAPLLRGSKAPHTIPDCMRLPQDPEALRSQQWRTRLEGNGAAGRNCNSLVTHGLSYLSACSRRNVDAGVLRPTPELLAEVEGQPALLAGFDDAEVMAAVAEIAADARLFEKHRHNAKARWRCVHRMRVCSRMRVSSTQKHRHARVCSSR